MEERREKKKEIPVATRRVVSVDETLATSEVPAPLSYSSYHHAWSCPRSPIIKINYYTLSIWMNSNWEIEGEINNK